ncbi:MAG: toll/interleukin-1 receptor domain-containing protein [Anaerolineae bacterium]|nr:toll/interleukin-1 receptor domain-containing protein [Anaerolineae bacterium]
MNAEILKNADEIPQKVYISFDHQDAAFADLLSSTLLRANFIISPHRRRTVTGETPDLSAENDLRESFVLIFICPSFVKTPFYTDFDWVYAIGAGIPVLPILLGNGDSLHPRLLTLQPLDFSNPTKGSWKYLVNRIKEIKEIREKQSNYILSKIEIDIFLSYSRHDRQVMQRLRDDLRAMRLNVWVDEEGLDPGTPAWEAAIGNAIRSAACLLVILSPDAEKSKWVGRELAMAETLNKWIFPVLVRGTEQDAIPFRLMTHQWIDARQDYAGAFEKLLGAVKKHLGM